MQPVATQLGHGDVLGLVLAADALGLFDEVLRDCDGRYCVWNPWLGLLLVRGDDLGEDLGETARGCAEVDGGGSGGEEIVELRGDVGLEQGWRSEIVWARRRLYCP